MTASLRAIVLAAGKGTRMRSALPKVLHVAAGRPLLHYVLDLCDQLEASTQVVVGHQADLVRTACARRAGLSFALQEPQSGTGHATQVALGALEAAPAGSSVLVLAGDVPLLRAETLRRLLDLRARDGASAAILSFRTPRPAAYGRVVRDPDGNVARIVEARDASPRELTIDEVNSSIYAFDEAALRECLARLRPDNAQSELYLTDVIGLLVGEGRKVTALVAEDPEETTGVNTAVELAHVEKELFLRRAHDRLAAGVAIERPDTVLLGPDVRIEEGAQIRAFTVIEGRSNVGARAEIGPFCRVENSEIGEGAVLLDSCLVRDSTVGPGATLGPFAHIRPESMIGAGAKVGNFVELKKTTLGAGSKAPHLSYLGDATIGERTNIGAGSITCNYDGVKKSPTIIEDGAFVGSNSIMVAPVTIGRGAYVAAGSVVTKDVPGGALAVGRARQENKTGWATRRAKKG
jgi:bifunctional UDP-N-acetylglucosamine pyrophosphorylase / glucosamine-1-phosphate N-acetyltransferase